MRYTHLFGPITSRRLGISLGVDCISAKTCNLDCIYCECGATTNKTMRRGAYVPASAVIAELTDYLKSLPTLDYITFGGSGEPTLNSELGAMARFVKREYPAYKTALLTNGTLMYLPEVREAILSFDCVLPSLDAVSEKVFALVNRPHPELNVGRMIDGLETFSRQYSGALWVEVFIVPGVNDTGNELSLFKQALLRVKPTRVQLNSLDRPGTCDNVTSATPDRLREIAAFLNPLPVEIISRGPSVAPLTAETQTALLSTIQRRPLTIEEIAQAAGQTINDCAAALKRLEAEKKIVSSVVNNRMFYKGIA